MLAVWAAAIGEQKPQPRRKRGPYKKRADDKRVRRVASAAANGWDRQALREQLAENDLGPLIWETEVGQRPKKRDISDQSPIYKTYWAQWKFLALRRRAGTSLRVRRREDGPDSHPPQQD